jgi:hypothetical protein
VQWRTDEHLSGAEHQRDAEHREGQPEMRKDQAAALEARFDAERLVRY